MDAPASECLRLPRGAWKTAFPRGPWERESVPQQWCSARGEQIRLTIRSLIRYSGEASSEAVVQHRSDYDQSKVAGGVITAKQAPAGPAPRGIGSLDDGSLIYRRPALGQKVGVRASF